jgi:hypothetical protein
MGALSLYLNSSTRRADAASGECPLCAKSSRVHALIILMREHGATPSHSTFLTDHRPYSISDGEVALQWPSVIEERRKSRLCVRFLTRQDRTISTETSFNVPSATTTTTNVGLSFCCFNPALTALPTPYSSAIAIASERSMPDIMKLPSSAFSSLSRLPTGVTSPSPMISPVDASIVPVGRLCSKDSPFVIGLAVVAA